MLAAWTEIGGATSYTTYVEPESIRRAEGRVTLKHLWDFPVQRYTHDNKRFHSLVAQGEYDCKEKRVRVLSSTFYQARQAAGEVVLEESKPSDWITIGPKSSWLPLWEHACK